MQQQEIDNQNAKFWDELCGSSLARSLGITEISSESLQRFDQAYFEYYPYLSQYVLQEELQGKRVLEIGLGFGTLGNLIALRDCNYFGLDIALNPAKMMRYRLGLFESERFKSCSQGSALAVPFADDYFDYVYTIGCLHHTGNLSLAIQELYRVLRPGGKAVVMLYNRDSFRQSVQLRWQRLRDRMFFGRGQEDVETEIRAFYDSNSAGEAAPYTEYLSQAQVRQLFRGFSQIKIDIQNFDDYTFADGRIWFRRKWFLSNIARLLGLDLYINAIK